MKTILLTTIIWVAATAAFAQQSVTDSTKNTTDSVKNHPKKSSFKISIPDGDGGKSVSINDTATTYHKPRHHGFSIGITLARLDLGLTTLVDNGSFTLRPQNQFLRYRSWKSSNNGFDVFQFGYRFDDNFKIYMSAGFDWTLIRLRDNITILPNQPVLTYKQDNIDFSKNRFSSSYLRIPLAFDWRSKEDASGHRFHFVVGPDAGFLLNGRVKQISDEFGKQKIDDTYHFASFRYGAYARVGYGAWGIFAKYYFNDMFENSPEQAGLKNFAFGIMLGF